MYTMAQTEQIQCKESMGWRNVAQTDVKSFVAQSPTKVYTDTVFTKAIATEHATDKWSSLNWYRAQDKMTPAAGYSLWGEGGFKYDSLN
jgi:hypothetical protein